MEITLGHTYRWHVTTEIEPVFASDYSCNNCVLDRNNQVYQRNSTSYSLVPV